MYKKLIALSIFFSINTNALEINNETPYIVKKGDTLWDISEHFLKNPWEWEKIWKLNPYIEDPNLIYPDDILYLIYKDGKPEVVFEKKAERKKTLSLNDGIKVKTTTISNSIPAIKNKALKDFVENVYISNENTDGKIVTSYTNKMLHYKGDKVIVDLKQSTKIGDVISIVDIEDKINIKDNLKLNVYNIIGELIIEQKHGDLFIAKIKKNKEDIKSGDLLVNKNFFDYDKKIFPSKAPDNIKGKVIYNYDRINASKNTIVVINKGRNDGVTDGNVLSVNTPEKEVLLDKQKYKIDPINKGYIFVYKVEDDFSYGIIVKNTDLIKVGDDFNSPF